MAEALKHLLGREAVDWLAGSLAAVHPVFDRAAFIAESLEGLEALELKQRAAHIAAAMKQHLPPSYPDAARIVARSLGPVVAATGENGSSVLRYMPHDAFVARFGLSHPQESFRLQEELTQRFTCEFSIRLFIAAHAEETLAQLRRWVVSDNAHLRRLVSEGMRPRLPWAPRLPAFQRDPQPVIALLELLKDDPVRYVQRSVANCINDIGKDHPDLAVDLCNAWLNDATPQRRWIVGHALRSLVKKGHRGALALMGGGGKPKIAISEIVLSPKRLSIGDKLSFSVVVTSEARQPQKLIADYRVFFVKANGQALPKVFKLKTLQLAAGESVRLKATLSFAIMTTRRHYPGVHRIELVVNGVGYTAGAVNVTARRKG